jgi:hypothetical protein
MPVSFKLNGSSFLIIYVFLTSSPTAASASGIPGADESGGCPPTLWRPSWPVRLRLLHHIGASVVQAPDPRAAPPRWRSFDQRFGHKTTHLSLDPYLPKAWNTNDPQQRASLEQNSIA